MYYSGTIIQMAGFNDDQTAIFFSSLVALTNMIFTIVGMSLIDRVGRRKLLISTLIGCVLGLFMLGMSFYSMVIYFFSSDLKGNFLFDFLSDGRFLNQARLRLVHLVRNVYFG